VQALVKLTLRPGDVDVVDRPTPVPPAGHVLVRTEAVGLCGSDVHAWRQDKGYEWVKPPVIFGHEAVGVVTAVGPDLEADWIGRRVVPISIDGCGHCKTCRRGLRQICPDRTVMGLSFDGAAAESFSVLAERLVPVDVDLPATVLALTEPLSVAYRAVRHVLESQPGAQEIVVTGPGPIGMMAALFLGNQGRKVVLVGAERDRDQRLVTASRLGITTTVAGDDFELAPEAWIEASGSANGLGLALRQTLPGGTVVVPGLYGAPADPDINLLVRREIRLQGSYGSQAEDYRAAMAVLADDPKMWASLVSVRPLADGVTGLEKAGAGQSFKEILVPHG